MRNWELKQPEKTEVAYQFYPPKQLRRQWYAVL